MIIGDIMKFFRIMYREGNKQRERYVISEDDSVKGTVVKSVLGIEITNPHTGHGGIYGGSSPYSLFVPHNAQIDELPLDEFSQAIIESLHKNYVRKSELQRLIMTLIGSDREDVDGVKIVVEYEEPHISKDMSAFLDYPL